MAAKPKPYRGPGYSLCRPRCATCFLVVCLIPVIYFTYNWHYSQSDVSTRSDLQFVLPGRKDSKCEDAFRGTPTEKYIQSKMYKDTILKLAQAVRQPSVKMDFSYLNSTPQIYGVVQYLADIAKAKKVCIVGTNMNIVSAHVLQSGKKAAVYLFRKQTGDPVNIKLEEYLKKTYNTRFNIYEGETMESLPKFSSSNHHKIYCDVMIVSAPLDYHVAKADVTNIARLARIGKNFIVFIENKYSISSQNGGRKNSADAWSEGKMTGLITEQMHCDFRAVFNPSAQFKGFSVGTVRRMPEKKDMMSPSAGSMVSAGRSVGPVAMPNVKLGQSDVKGNENKVQIQPQPSSSSLSSSSSSSPSKLSQSDNVSKSTFQQAAAGDNRLKFGTQAERTNVNRYRRRNGTSVFGQAQGFVRSDRRTPQDINRGFTRRNGTRVGPNGVLRGNTTGRVRRLRLRTTQIPVSNRDRA